MSKSCASERLPRALGTVSKFRRAVCQGAEILGRQRRGALRGISIGLAVLLPAAFASAQQIPQQELNFFTEPYAPPLALRPQGNVNLVEANVVVRNAKGEPVGGLQQGDFKIFDDGKQQAITQFAVERAAPPTAAAQGAAGAPRSIALFFDDRSTPGQYFSYAQEAAEKFVREDLHPGDKVGVFTASNTHRLDFTADTQKVLETIESLHAIVFTQPQPRACPGVPVQFTMGPYAAYLVAAKRDQTALNFFSCNGGGGGASTAGGSAPGSMVPPNMQGPGNRTTSEPSFSIGSEASASQAATLTIAQAILSLWQGMAENTLGSLDAVVSRLGQRPGPRVLVLTSSGFFTSALQPAVDQVAGDALQNQVVINALDAKGLVAATGSLAADTASPVASGSSNQYYNQLLQQQQVKLVEGMGTLALDTGGTLIQNLNALAGGPAGLGRVPEVSYRLGFVPSERKADGRLHHLKLEVTAPGSLEVRARSGYYAPAKPSKEAKNREHDLGQQVLATDEIAGFPVQVGAQAGRLPSGETGLAVSLHVDPKTLAFKKAHGRHQDTLNLVVALLSPAGQFVTGESGAVQMNLKDDSLANIESRGINPTIVLKAGEGNYRLRVVMEDAESGKTFATARPVTIP